MSLDKKVQKRSRFRQGFYTPRNPDKYVGNLAKIRYMSSWELQTNKFFDSNPNILRWSSEEIAIPYTKPTTGRVHRYFPDYWIEYKTSRGDIVQEIIEVKPKAQTKRTRSRNPKTRLYEDLTLAINIAKWESAKRFCDKYGIKFRIITENEIFK